MRVEVVVDEVVLHDVDPRDRHRIGDAIERQIRARLARGALIERIASNIRDREQVVTDVVTQSVREAVLPAASRKS